MNILALDCETTTHNKGHLHDIRNHLVCTSWASSDGESGCVRGVEGIQERVSEADLIVGFNWKFDLGWLKYNGIDFSGKPFYDCQLAEFILSRQTWAYPDLDTAASNRLGLTKIDVVKNDYWSKGINTDEIPWEILSEYAIKDAELTLALYHAQMPLLTVPKRRLLHQQCMDLEILQEMEWNGLMFDEEKCERKAAEIEQRIREIQYELAKVIRRY